MKLQTPVTDLPRRTSISFNDRILTLGSCFSDNIGRALADYGFEVLANPFGTLYNPASILEALRRLESGEDFSFGECVPMGAGAGRFCSFSHHTSFARATPEEFLANANAALLRAREFYGRCNKVIITLGTAWCFRREGRIVSNCLKRPASEFERFRLTPDECTSTLREMVKLVSALPSAGRPSAELPSAGMSAARRDIIFTVSPIRHLADGAHGNQLSKATLLTAIDTIISELQQHPAAASGSPVTPGHAASSEGAAVPGHATAPVIDYFPAYEIMMDELRDYRFYAEDMVHPSAQAINYILERFLTWALPSSQHPTLQENIRHHKATLHRPSSPSTLNNNQP